MAHWIIDDHGFGGQYYREKKKNPTSLLNPALIITNHIKALQAYDEMETKLMHLTGYDVKKLIDLFAAYASIEDLAKGASKE